MDQMEKVQEPSDVMGGAPVRMELKPERIQLLLQRVPEWRLRADGLGIERVRPVADAGQGREIVDHVCRVASVLRQPVSVAVDSKRVVITLKGHPVRGCVGGLTEPVFKLAEILG